MAFHSKILVIKSFHINLITSKNQTMAAATMRNERPWLFYFRIPNFKMLVMLHL